MIKSAMVSSEHSTVLMKWLSRATKRLGRDVAENTYVVGGAVRNFKLNMPVKDVDLVLDSIALGENSAWLADELADMIPARTETVSDQYGVAKIFVKSEWIVDDLDLSEFSADGDAAIEIVDARSETYSDDTGGGYKPSISKSTIREDIYRRDFTFNTLMWRLADLAEGPEKAEIVDLTGCGLSDLEAGEARCPLDPEQTFYDDPTRILRAVKFLVKYGLNIPKDTARAIKKTKGALKKVHFNRVYSELSGILSESTWEKTLKTLDSLGVIEVLEEIAKSNEGFRASLSTKAKSLPYMFFIKLLNLGLPIRHDLSFLERDQIDRMEELYPILSEEERDDLTKALKTPGWAIKDKKFLPSIAREKGLSGRDVGSFMAIKMEQLRDLYLESPMIIYRPNETKDRITDARTANQRVAQRYMKSKLFGLLSNHIGWQDLKRFQDQLQWMFKKGQHKVTSVLDRKGEKIIKVEAPNTKISISGFTQKGSGFDYKNLTVEINGRVSKKTDDLEVVRRFVQKTLLGLGLRQ